MGTPTRCSFLSFTFARVEFNALDCGEKGKDGGIEGSRCELSKNADEEGWHIPDFVLPVMSDAASTLVTT